MGGEAPPGLQGWLTSTTDRRDITPLHRAPPRPPVALPPACTRPRWSESRGQAENFEVTRSDEGGTGYGWLPRP